MKEKTPFVMFVSRILFFLLLIVQIWMLMRPPTPHSDLAVSWLVYLVIIYAALEVIYHFFWKRGVDLTYAFPLLFAIYVLNFVSLIIDGQQRIPDVNRAEHLTTFIFVTYIVWVFFTKYLPHNVWHDHPYYTSILSFSVVSAAGVVNEIVELFLDITFGTKTIGMGYDTNYDLTMNTLGAVLFLSFNLIYSHISSKKR